MRRDRVGRCVRRSSGPDGSQPNTPRFWAVWTTWCSPACAISTRGGPATSPAPSAPAPAGANCSCRTGPTRTRPWFLNRAEGGGNLLERASHGIDLERAIAGEVAAVQASAAAIPLAQSTGERGDIEDAAAIVLQFGSGAVGSVSVAWT